MELTQEKKEEYRRVSIEFGVRKKDITRKLQEEYIEHNNRVKELNSQLNIPLIEGCDSFMVCEKCGIHSMEFEGTAPGQGEHYRWYKCLLCGNEDYHT